MGDLSEATGLSKSSLYHHIDGKEHLLKLALERAVEPLFGVLHEPRATEGRAVDRLEHVIRREVEVLASRLPYVTLLLRVHGNTELERWALEKRREFDRMASELVAQAAAEGDIRRDLDPALVTKLVFGMINSLVNWYHPAGFSALRDGSRSIAAGELADAVLGVVFDGLRTGC